MSIDNILGQGATEAFVAAVAIPDDEPAITYSDWQYEPMDTSQLPDGLTITVDEDPWPGTGTWRLANILWSSVSQQVFFQDDTMVWGDGLCKEGGGDGGTLKRLASPEMKTFLATYVSVLKVRLPNLEDFYMRFLLAGFEIVDQSESLVEIQATLRDPNSRMAELFTWRINGTAPEEEPAWRTELRLQMGLDSLFP
jgi:hypothetical protein